MAAQVGQHDQRQRDADDGVQHGGDPTLLRHRGDVAVACNNDRTDNQSLVTGGGGGGRGKGGMLPKPTTELTISPLVTGGEGGGGNVAKAYNNDRTDNQSLVTGGGEGGMLPKPTTTTELIISLW